ncbi:hypothetical protein GHT06_007649 [Daphnia sinensis]|uniref:Uncharacterized protein n=1 Tax=Daphnia sinensis TaxID=1820382 RepID=A0AAD5KFZ2_9CRUS|nr:hypothetical protein GHT06_007649 [Daphnia sinensis]
MVVEVMDIWKRASIPTITKANLFKMVQRLIEKFDNVQRHFSFKFRESAESKKFKSSIDELFDVCSCKCYKPKSNALKVIDLDSVDHAKCQCDLKIPPNELNFYLDQKSTRLFVISNNVDLAGSFELSKRLQRAERKHARQQESAFKKKTCNASTAPLQNNASIDELVQEDVTI